MSSCGDMERPLKGPLVVVSPACTWLGLDAPLALVVTGPVHEHVFDAGGSKCHGRHMNLTIGSGGCGAVFTVEDGGMGGVRLAEDPRLSLDASGGTHASAPGQRLAMHCTLEHPEWIHQFVMYPDGTMGPVDAANAQCPQLRLGTEPGGGGVVAMVPRGDAGALIFAGPVVDALIARAQLVSRALPPPLAGTDRTVLLIKSPQCSWLGPGPKALVASAVSEHTFQHAGDTIRGRHMSLHVGAARDATAFFLDGPPAWGMTIRLHSERRIMLDSTGGNRAASEGTRVNLHGTLEHPEWVQTWRFGADGTIGPVHPSNSRCGGLCLGVRAAEGGRAEVVLVPRGAAHALVFGSPADVEEHAGVLAEERGRLERLQTAGAQRCTREMRALLRRDGFVHMPGLIPGEVVKRARREINRQMGVGALSTSRVDAFKGKASAAHPSILALVDDSLTMVPHVLAELLGGTAEAYRGQVTSGQLALRFPGDLCPGDTAECSLSHWQGLRKGWHIDGCASGFLEGVTDHYGAIRNFSALVGCLLSDIDAPLSGELCMYPGSHEKLAGYLSESGRLEELRTKGEAVLPTGDPTDRVFDRPLVPCLGKAGDVFIANYMTAHLVAPNTAPDIRYAVYFRVNAPCFLEGRQKNGSRLEAMLDPWCDWVGLQGESSM